MEIWQGNKLVGGVYGLAIGAVFFGESMFSKKTQASKAALTILLEHLKKKRFCILDVQFLTEHLRMFGAKEVSFEYYEELLEKAYSKNVVF